MSTRSSSYVEDTITNMEWSLHLTILRLRRWFVYNVVFVLHLVRRRRSAPSARPQLKCKDGLPLFVTIILRTICAPNIKQSGWNMTQSTSILSAINFSPMCLSYSRIQSKRILFPSLWASDRLSLTSTRMSSKLLPVTWCTKLKMKLITTMKMLRRILCLAKRTTILVQCQTVVAKVKERALLLFKWIEPDKDGVLHSYIFKIPKTKTKLFHLVICYVLCGTSFRMAANIISYKYKVLSDPSLCFYTRHHVNNFVKVFYAVNLQRIPTFYDVYGLSRWHWIPLPTKSHRIVNHWLSTYKVTKWFKIHHPKLLMHIESK